MREDYKNDRKAKKDVIDPAGDAHSVKAGEKKWQAFLYSRRRFEEDDGFQALNGVGSLLIHCIDAFPPSYADYRRNPRAAKERLRTPMRELKDRFQRKALLRAFLRKAIFNGGEVDYLTFKHDEKFHVCRVDYLTFKHDEKFHVCRNDDVIRVMGECVIVKNSQASGDNPDCQKVLFCGRPDGKNEVNIGELEMRNDSETHYQEVRFNINKQPCVTLLLSNLLDPEHYSKEILVYGVAKKTFGNWHKPEKGKET